MQKRTLELRCGVYTLVLEDVPNQHIKQTLISNAADGQRVIVLGEDDPQSAVCIQASASSGEWTITVAADGAPTVIHEHSAVCFNDQLAVAVGPFIACISVPTGDPQWEKKCDWASCFGVYALAKEAALIVHGELDITKLSTDGEILWQTSGKDIFTGPFQIEAEGIRAADFYDDVYLIKLDNGDIAIIEHGEMPKPPV